MMKKTQSIHSKNQDDFLHQILAIGHEIRYVAICEGIKVLSHQRQDLLQASSNISDLYEELFVNPTLMKILTQRGTWDCGGFEYVLVRYKNFFQFIAPISEAVHISIAMEVDTDTMKFIPLLRDKIKNLTHLFSH